MFFSKFFIVVFLFLFSVSVFGMDFSDDGGMNFDDNSVQTTHKKAKKSKRKHHRKKKKKKNKKKKVVKKAPVEDSGMTFGEDDAATKENTSPKEDSGMNFGDDSNTETKTESEGMNFGDEDAGMVFGDEDAKEEGKIDQKEMNFDMAEIEKDVKPKNTKKEDKVKITKKRNTYVVKGVYFKLATGTTYLLSPKLAEKITPNEKSLLGFNTHLTLGYDLNTALSLELYGEFIFNQAQIKGSSNILYSRDFNSRTVGLGINFNVLNSERSNLHLNLHGGLLMIDPSLEIDGLKISAGGLIGFEYYLLLKYFYLKF